MLCSKFEIGNPNDAQMKGMKGKIVWSHGFHGCIMERVSTPDVLELNRCEVDEVERRPGEPSRMA